MPVVVVSETIQQLILESHHCKLPRLVGQGWQFHLKTQSMLTTIIRTGNFGGIFAQETIVAGLYDNTFRRQRIIIRYSTIAVVGDKTGAGIKTFTTAVKEFYKIVTTISGIEQHL